MDADNTKKIQSPYYSPEDLKKYYELLQHGILEAKNLNQGEPNEILEFPGCYKDENENWRFDITEEEQEKVLFFHSMFKDYVFDPKAIDIDLLSKALTAKGLSEYAKEKNFQSEIILESKNECLGKSIAAAGKAFSIHPLPIYFYELATYVERTGNADITKKVYEGFLDMQSKFIDNKMLGPFLSYFYNHLIVEEIVRDAKSKLL